MRAVRSEVKDKPLKRQAFLEGLVEGSEDAKIISEIIFSENRHEAAEKSSLI